MGRGDDPSVDRNAFAGADRGDLACVEDLKEHTLGARREGVDRVEEECPFARLFKDAGVGRLGSREGAGTMSEERALEQRFRDRGAVDRDKGRRGVGSEAVEFARPSLFSRAGLADNADRASPWRQTRESLLEGL